ncbi:MFS transporter [Staphylococcus epidermidis]|uniref:multidrug efflux MFS transporter Nms n=1 Tax=Staphylococcus epidermidis TaxID=1282 RepID=UPI000D1C6FD2|nr:MFS transporter [Staphylococcus epidermidis]PTE97011.1 MFS transporter [Staphylococcus epidermidis]
MENTIFQKNKWSFIGATYAFLIIMMGTTIPTPLYPIYSETYDLSPLLITMIYAVYAIGVIGGLLVFGQLSDRIGRRYILLPGIILSALSALIFLFADSLLMLFAGRIVSGLSAGLFTSTATVTLVNLVPQNKKSIASTLASLVNMLGLGLGPLLSGALVQYLPFPMRLIFIIDFVTLIPAFMGVWFMTEPIQNKRPFKLKVQRLSVPSEMKHTFTYAVIPVFAGFSMLGLFTSISPNFLEETLGIHHKAIIGIVVFLAFFASAMGQLLFKSIDDYKILIVGSIALILGVACVGLSLLLYSLAILILGAITSGIGQAFSFRAGLSLINSKAPTKKQGEVTSSFFTIAYVALSIPVIGVGLLEGAFCIQTAGIIFSIIIMLLSFLSLTLLLLSKKESSD